MAWNKLHEPQEPWRLTLTRNDVVKFIIENGGSESILNKRLPMFGGMTANVFGIKYGWEVVMDNFKRMFK